MSEWRHGLTEPPPNRTAAPVATRDGGIKKTTEKVSTKTYTAISLLDKWRLAQEIFADPKLSPTAKVVAGVLLNCLNCRTGKCCPRLAYLAARIGRKRRVISAAIVQLRQRGWLTRRGRRGSSIYRFDFDRLQRDDVQETASHEPADAQEPAYLDVQDSALQDTRETALLNTGNFESGNRNQEVMPPGDQPSLGAAKGNHRPPRPGKNTPVRGLAAVGIASRIRNPEWSDRGRCASRVYQIQEPLHRQGHPDGRLGSRLAKLMHPGHRICGCATKPQCRQSPQP